MYLPMVDEGVPPKPVHVLRRLQTALDLARELDVAAAHHVDLCWAQDLSMGVCKEKKILH